MHVHVCWLRKEEDKTKARNDEINGRRPRRREKRKNMYRKKKKAKTKDRYLSAFNEIQSLQSFVALRASTITLET